MVHSNYTLILNILSENIEQCNSLIRLFGEVNFAIIA